eukprot:CAMPEP_0115480792 /NCGR_PEP_ID=MMETSP0271-20121206/57455_1 /TAXON_ID=71861 /ORGANISM="Scrippsiella trochoidea, Strain CCMP3099" /LENGTH=372 /DNA_ID=CAMNT_0002908487 /DNA_START=17 /DNA_END=1135 /DNA_ORIENTATION=+
MAPMKRPAASSASGVSKKVAKDPLAAKGDEIAAMLHAAEGFPEAVIHAIATNLDKSLLIPKDQRHAFQEEVVGMIEQVLVSVEKALQSKAGDAQAKVAGSDSEKSVREQAVLAAEAVIAEKVAAVDAAKAALNEAAGEDAAAKTGMEDAKAEQKTGDAGYVEAAKKKSTLEAMFTDEYSTVKHWNSSNSWKKSVQAVVRICKQFGFEPQLLVSAEPALSKPPDERGSFDNLVLQQLEDQIKSVLQQLGETLSNGEADKAARAGKVESAAARLASAVERFKACKVEVATTSSAVKEAEAQCMAAKKKLREFGPQLELATSELEAANVDLKDCEAVLASFRVLQGRTSVMEVAPIAEPAAAVELEGEAGAVAAE